MLKDKMCGKMSYSSFEYLPESVLLDVRSKSKNFFKKEVKQSFGMARSRCRGKPSYWMEFKVLIKSSLSPRTNPMGKVAYGK